MPGKRRSIHLFPTVTRTEFGEILKKARATRYVRKPELAMRDASLLAFEFLFKARVSEGVGRTYPEKKQIKVDTAYMDQHKGVFTTDFKLGKVKGQDVLMVRLRILKRGRRKKICSECGQRCSLESIFCNSCGSHMKDVKFDARMAEVWVWDSVSLSDPFVKYIQEWLSFLEEQNYSGRVWPITRQRAWQIARRLGIMNHTQRHWRATQLADTMDAFELREALHRATVPHEYVHRAAGRKLEKEKEADELWK